ncbi:MAG: hypothetical protein SPH68_04610 [Candidatus Borkfalkiaceae bacterium]|nr:hypothetical protein [Clostridia bacterium]MDY6223421.1 hypothetical protein [Christensenellaceae bacterium]
MKAKKIVTVLLTAIVFLSAAFLGVSAVYRVEEVTLVTHNVSAAAETEAEQLKAQLEKAYLKRSTILADDAAAKEAIAAFAYFRLTGFEKDYPGRLIVTATEDIETYAVARGENYAIYSAEGTLLSVRESKKNRADGTDNLTVLGIKSAEESAGAESGAGNFADTAVFSVLRALDLSLSGIRGNVTKAELVKPTSRPQDDYLTVFFREGVQAVIYAPDSFPQEKAAALYKTYAEELTLFQRTCGTIYVSLDCSAHYQRSDG